MQNNSFLSIYHVFIPAQLYKKVFHHANKSPAEISRGFALSMPVFSFKIQIFFLYPRPSISEHRAYSLTILHRFFQDIRKFHVAVPPVRLSPLLPFAGTIQGAYTGNRRYRVYSFISICCFDPLPAFYLPDVLYLLCLSSLIISSEFPIFL